jgi:hypothetical protein
MALQFLPYALAAYGGYRGYKASKDAGGSGLQRLLAGATGAAAGYYGGKGALSGGSALNIPGFSAAQSSFTPFLQTAPMQSIGATFPALGIPQTTAASTNMYPFMGDDPGVLQGLVGTEGTPTQQGGGLQTMFDKAFRRKRFVNGKPTGEMEFSPGKVAAGIAGLSYLSGAFENEPQDVYTPTYNTKRRI